MREQYQPTKPLGRVNKEDRREMEKAHAQGLHDELPREFCPACEELNEDAQWAERNLRGIR